VHVRHRERHLRGRRNQRLRVSDLTDQIKTLDALGVITGEPVVIADMVRVIDVADPDGNEVSYVEELTQADPTLGDE